MSLNDEFKDNDLQSKELTDDQLENVIGGGNRYATFKCVCGRELTGDGAMKSEILVKCGGCRKIYAVNRRYKTVTYGYLWQNAIDNVRWWG